MGGRQAQASLPARDRRAAPHVGLLRGEQGRVRGLRGHDAARRGSSRSTRPSSTSAGSSGSPGRHPRSPNGCGRGSSQRSGSRSPSASRARSSSRRSRVRSRSPTVCSSFLPTTSSAFLHPLPVERLWGVGRVTAAKLHDRGITTVAQVAALDEATLVCLLGRASGRHIHALAHNRDPRRVHDGPSPAVDRLAACAGSKAEILPRDRLVGHRHRRSRRPEAPCRSQAVPHRRSPPSVRRLLACDAVVHDASID